MIVACFECLRLLSKIPRAIRKGEKGGYWCMSDSGRGSEVHTVPEWLLPVQEGEDRRRRPKPDIVLVEGAYEGAEPPQEAERGGCTVRMLEVQFTAEDKVDEAEERKKEKYAELEDRLKSLGWRVEETVAVVIGARGVLYRNGADAVQTMGLTKERTEDLMGQLHRHAVKSLGDMIRQRRRLEPDTASYVGGRVRAGVG